MRLAAKLQVELETLKAFKNRVDALLDDLTGSPAAPKEIGRDRLTAAHLGTGFGEAESLTSAYQYVHDQLDVLSQTLSDQIEAMSISIDGAHRGYENVEAEQCDRLWTIRQRTESHYKHPGGTGAQSSGSDAAKQSEPQPDATGTGDGGMG